MGQLRNMMIRNVHLAHIDHPKCIAHTIASFVQLKTVNQDMSELIRYSYVEFNKMIYLVKEWFLDSKNFFSPANYCFGIN